MEVMSEIECMIDDVAAETVVLLMTKRDMSFLEAIDTVYTSDAYSKLCVKEIGLYYQSPKYVYSFLEHELLTGVIG